MQKVSDRAGRKHSDCVKQAGHLLTASFYTANSFLLHFGQLSVEKKECCKCCVSRYTETQQLAFNYTHAVGRRSFVISGSTLIASNVTLDTSKNLVIRKRCKVMMVGH